MTQADQQVSAEALKTVLAGDIEYMVEQVAQAISDAGADDVIGHSEHQVRDVLGTFRTRVFQRAVQMRLDAADAAFSPSAEPDGGGLSIASQGASEPGRADGQRSDPG